MSEKSNKLRGLKVLSYEDIDIDGHLIVAKEVYMSVSSFETDMYTKF